MFKILCVDDEAYNLKLYQDILKNNRYEIITSNNLEEAERFIEISHPDLLLLDLKFNHKTSVSGLDFLKEQKKKQPLMEVIVISGSSASLTKSRALIEFHAHDYLEKPIKSEQLRIIVERALEKLKLIKENSVLKRSILSNQLGIIGKSTKIIELQNQIEKVAHFPTSVLISGETGTGKELVARAIHKLSLREKFLAIDCATITPNLFESRFFGHKKGAFTGADSDTKGFLELIQDGTLFIDELENLALENQQKLLRLIENKNYMSVGGDSEKLMKARLIFGTNIKLEELANAGKFRLDLLHRINTINIHVPKLDERKEDIPLLVDYFMEKISQELSISKLIHDSALEYLKSRKYSGNVRELRNLIERALIMGHDDHMIFEEDFKSQKKEIELNKTHELFSLKLAEQNAKNEAIKKALLYFKGNETEASLALKISLRHLQRLITEFNIDV